MNRILKKTENFIKKVVLKVEGAIGFFNISQNVCNTKYNKNCLVSYIRYPFEFRTNHMHQAEEQVYEIVNILSRLGYNVDVINYNDNRIVFFKKYDLLFEISVKDDPIYKKFIKRGAKKIAYLTGSEHNFSNNAEQKRLNDLYRRRGIMLIPRRQVPTISKNIEKYDKCIMIGNKYNFNTYNKYNIKNISFVPNTGYDFAFVFDKYLKKSTSFIYFGSVGCVHKGLDLLLEIFTEKNFPCKLYVCGDYEKEKDFIKEYSNELFNSNNIIPVGFVNVFSDVFRKMCEECVFSILPSCSEGCAGTVSTSISAGLIPICSRECGYEENEVIILDNCSKECIKNTIIECSNININTIEKMSKKCISLYESKYNIGNFSKCMEQALRY